ncbi:MAG: TolC family protein [Bacteroidales bacterium]|nr:TolC family protein [Bacteroidales bacterium]
MKKIFLFVIAMSSLVLRAQNDSQTLRFTLQECLEYAYSNSYDRQSMELSNRSQQLSYEQSKEQRLPSVNASMSEGFSSTNYSSNFSGNIGVNAGVAIYQGGQINANIKKEQLATEQSSLEITRYDDNLAIQILQSFLTILGNEELLNYQKSVLNSSREAMKQGKRKYEVGSIIESDYLLLEAQYASDTNNIIDTQIEIENNLMNLKVLLSMDPMKDLQIVSPDTSIMQQLSVFPTLEEAVEQSIAYSPDLKISSYDIDIAKQSLRIARANFYPSVNLSAGINTGHNNFKNMGQQFGDRLSEQIGLSVSIPIYSRGSTKLRVKQSEIALEQTQLSYEQNLLSTRQTIVQEYNNMISTYNKYNVSKRTKDAYLKSFESYNVQFQYGSITAVELLQQQNSYLNALNNFIQNKYSFILQRKIMDIYMGK